MRIQHNIPAMNAYRNYNSNTKALQGNLQKLSSGYKINKAGDDAAGLAISEKMRAQITGLEVAQKNAKDGISLVQTAEGATTEIHTMLNRMFSLAEQSANGTYDDKVDRVQLNNEFTKLKDEIDRIADATNFNGRKLLDGSLDGGGAKVSNNALTVANADNTLTAATADATTGKYTFSQSGNATVANGDILELSFTLTGADGASETVTAQMKVDGTKLKTADGKTELATLNSGTAVTNAEMSAAFTALLTADKELGAKFADFNVTATATYDIEFKAKTDGAAATQVTSGSITNTTTTANTVTTKLQVEKGADAFQTLDLSTQATTWDGTADTLKDSIIEVNGKKFVFLDKNKTADNDALAEAGVGSNVIEVATTVTNPTATDIQKMATMIEQETGLDTTMGTLAAGKWTDAPAAGATAGDVYIGFKQVTDAADANKSSGGLRLRVGDSTESYDDITVSIKSMKADKLSDLTEGTGKVLKDLSVDDQGNADIAMKALKGMINYVSNERGELGATQNRLDHTINNLSTMQENIQDAEATIRDVDVAEEMMKYTKNNILVQSAQAMLAQANQLPQGVLQLLG